MPRRRNPTDAEIKLLVKLSKKSKGILDMNLASEALAPFGWKFEASHHALGMERSDVGWGIQQRLKSCSDYFSVQRGELQFWKPDEAACAQRMIPTVMEIVGGEPTDPSLGTYYATDPSKSLLRNGRTVVVTEIWRGGVRWTVTAPGGTKKHFDVSDFEAVNLGPLWTFLYKNGAAEAAKTYLGSAQPESIAKATATRAERARVEMERSALPEVAAVFRQITQARYDDVVAYLEEQFRAATQEVVNMGSTRIGWHEIPWGNVVGRLTESYYTGTGSGYAYRPREAFERMVRSEAVRLADETREAFVLKNTARISEIATRKGSLPTAKLLHIGEGYGGYGGEILFSFPDGSSFVLRNKTVWKRSSGGVTFAQFPTTFHDVKLPGGKKMASPSEKRMLDVFSRATEANPTGRPSSHERGLASRLARA